MQPVKSAGKHATGTKRGKILNMQPVKARENMPGGAKSGIRTMKDNMLLVGSTGNHATGSKS